MEKPTGIVAGAYQVAAREMSVEVDAGPFAFPSERALHASGAVTFVPARGLDLVRSYEFGIDDKPSVVELTRRYPGM